MEKHKTKQLVFVLAIVLFGLSSCASRHQIGVINPGSSRLAYSEWHHSFIFGLTEGGKVNAAEICGSANRVAKVEQRWTFLNALAGIVGFGLWIPYTANVYCKS